MASDNDKAGERAKRPYSVRLDESTAQELRKLEEDYKREYSIDTVNGVYKKIIDNARMYAASSSAPPSAKPFLEQITSAAEVIVSGAGLMARLIDQAESNADAKLEVMTRRSTELIRELSERLEESEARCAKLTSENAGLMGRNAELRQTVDELKEQIKGSVSISEASLSLAKMVEDAAGVMSRLKEMDLDDAGKGSPPDEP